jgi:hypothetical protein
MRLYTFNFEIQTLLEQFVSAFNDIIIKRYDNNKTLTSPTSGNYVKFVYAPKQRVYETINTPAPGGITLPVVAVNITSVARDQARVFNKIEGFVANAGSGYSNGLVQKIPQPVPINITVNMTIITKYQTDMDQIISNFIPYCDPYIIISWKLPSFSKNTEPYELRSEVLWNGTVNMSYPTELNNNQAQRLTAETSFTIKGWLFKKMDETVKKIYTIDTKYIDQEPTVKLTPAQNNTTAANNQPIEGFNKGDLVFIINNNNENDSIFVNI